jgi:hypothetical protein
MLKNHWDDLEIAPLRHATQVVHQLSELPGTGCGNLLVRGCARAIRNERVGAARSDPKAKRVERREPSIIIHFAGQRAVSYATRVVPCTRAPGVMRS